MGEGGYSEKNEYAHKEKIPCKGNEGVYFGESCNWWGDMVAWFKVAWFSYLSYTPFERLDDGYTTECRHGMIFVT